MLLHEIKIIDLKHSNIDKEKSNPKDGEYVFIEKKFIDYKDKGRRPPHYFTWCRFEPSTNYREYREWQVKWGYQPVTKKDSYIPNGMTPNTEGNYVYGDLILVKCPLIDELLRREEQDKMAKRGGKAKMAELQSEYGAAAVSEEDIQKMLKSFGAE